MIRDRHPPTATLLLALASLLLPGAGAAALPDLDEEWIELRSPDFRLVSNAGERKAAEIATSLERFRAVLERLRPGSRFRSPLPTKIVAFRNDASFRPYKRWRGSDALAGVFIGHQHGNYIALDAFPSRGDSLPVVYHEYVHFFVRHNLPDLPLALNEGLAEYYSTFQVIGKKAQVGLAVPQHLRWARTHSFLPLEALFAVAQGSPEYEELESKGGVYAQSWALVHYLLSGDEELRRQGVELLRRLDAGAPAAEAVGAAMGIGTAELESRLRRYVNGRRFPFYEVPLTDLDAPSAWESRRLAPEEVLFHLGDLLLHSPGDQGAEAREHFAAATERNPSYPEAYTGLGLVAEAAGDAAAAERFLAEAVARGSTNALAYLVSADLLLRRTAGGGPPPADAEPPWLRARRLLEQAQRLDPGFAQVEALLGLTYFEDPAGSAGGVPHLERAVAMLPDRPEIAYNLAVLHLRSGDVAAARAVGERHLTGRGRPDLVAKLDQGIAQARLSAAVDAANEALAAGESERAVEILRRAREEAREPATAAQLDGHLRRIESEVEAALHVARYNHAVELANQGRLADALVELRALEAEIRDPNLLLDARGLIRELAAMVE